MIQSVQIRYVTLFVLSIFAGAAACSDADESSAASEVVGQELIYDAVNDLVEPGEAFDHSAEQGLDKSCVDGNATLEKIPFSQDPDMDGASLERLHRAYFTDDLGNAVAQTCLKLWPGDRECVQEYYGRPDPAEVELEDFYDSEYYLTPMPRY